MGKGISPEKNKTLKMAVTALMIALIFIFSRFLGINTDVVHLGFDFLPVVIIAYLYGPIWAAVTAILGDLVCAIGMPLGVINPGITVVAGIIGLVYGFAFHDRSLRGKSLIITSIAASLIVAGIIKLFITTMCLAFAYGTPYWTTLLSRIPNCALLLLIQSVTIPLVIRYVAIPAEKMLKSTD